MAGNKRAVFLDRDGTIIEEKEYLHRPEKVVIFPGVGPALRALQDAGFALIMVTNQSGIGRGYFSVADSSPRTGFALPKFITLRKRRINPAAAANPPRNFCSMPGMPLASIWPAAI